MELYFFVAGSLLGALGVAFGAFGAHALRSLLGPERLTTFETGVRYQMYHALALIAVALAPSALIPSPWFDLAGWVFIAGTILFSGSLYLLSVSGRRAFGAITPFGGIALIAGWLGLAVAIWQG